MILKRSLSAFVEATRTFVTPAVPRDAAAISWFTLFSLVPAALVFLSLVDAFLGWMNLHEQVLRQIATLFPGARGLGLLVLGFGLGKSVEWQRDACMQSVHGRIGQGHQSPSRR